MCFGIPIFKKETASLIFILVFFQGCDLSFNGVYGCDEHNACPAGLTCVGNLCVAKDAIAVQDAAGPDDGLSMDDGFVSGSDTRDLEDVYDTRDLGRDRDSAGPKEALDAISDTNGDFAPGFDSGMDLGNEDTVEEICIHKTCVGLGMECGKGDDGCGATLSCGTCDSGKVCDSSHKCQKKTLTCGDSTCDGAAGENCATCVADCACKAGQTCFNAVCCTPKTCSDLGWACGTWDDGCGGQLDCGTCNAHQACETGKCVDQPWCGNGKCDQGETCQTCAADCGCGNGQVCYSNACCTPKTCADQGWACGTWDDDGCGGQIDCGTCNAHQVCETGKCVDQPWCGNGKCDQGETCQTCAKDCGCGNGQVCYNNACCTPKTCADQGWECGTGDDGCGATLSCGTCDSGKVCQSKKCVILVWKDPTTGYEWQVKPGTGMAWQDAVDFCKNLDGGGWHLPTISELRTLIRGCNGPGECGNPNVSGDSCKVCDELKGPGPNGVYGPGELEWPNDGYWSSSSVAGDPGYAWSVYFDGGYVDGGNAEGSLHSARCVRLGP